MPVVAPRPRTQQVPDRLQEVFIIGAGFSKAICPLMPLVDELGYRITAPFKATPSFSLLSTAAAAALRNDKLPGGNLEAWLSHLATPAPFLSEAERLHNSAIAQELIGLIVDEIDRSQGDTLRTSMPHWLSRLVTLWERFSSTVLTFNYDTLVEYAIKGAAMPWASPLLHEDIVSVPTPEYWSDQATMRLLKMHGSINWLWAPGDRLGDTLIPMQLKGTWGAPEARVTLPGRAPLLVPPLAIKSEYYDVNVVRGLWQLAKESLTRATRIVLMGYSAPLTDLTVTALLSNYGAPMATPVLVVDTAADDVAKRLKAIGFERVESFIGTQPIREFTERYEEEISEQVAGMLLPFFDGDQFHPDEPVIARTSHVDKPSFPVTEIQDEDGVRVLVATKWKAEDHPGQGVADSAIKARRLREAIEEAEWSRQRLILRMPGEPDKAVLHLARFGYNRNWLAVEA